MIQELCQLRSYLLEERIENAYAKRGNQALSDEETEQLVASCIEEVEAATWPSRQQTAQPQQGKGAPQW